MCYPDSYLYCASGETRGQRRIITFAQAGRAAATDAGRQPDRSPDWLAHLAHFSTDDLRRISRLVDLLVTADRAAADTAGTMPAARPDPATVDDARALCRDR